MLDEALNSFYCSGGVFFPCIRSAVLFNHRLNYLLVLYSFPQLFLADTGALLLSLRRSRWPTAGDAQSSMVGLYSGELGLAIHLNGSALFISPASKTAVDAVALVILELLQCGEQPSVRRM